MSDYASYFFLPWFTLVPFFWQNTSITLFIASPKSKADKSYVSVNKNVSLWSLVSVFSCFTVSVKVCVITWKEHLITLTYDWRDDCQLCPEAALIQTNIFCLGLQFFRFPVFFQITYAYSKFGCLWVYLHTRDETFFTVRFRSQITYAHLIVVSYSKKITIIKIIWLLRASGVFWAKRKKRSVGGADKSCESVNKNFT